MAYYPSYRVYIKEATELCDKIERIKAIVTAMEEAMLTGASGQDTEEYQLNDGQTRINVKSRSMKELTESYFGLQAMLEMYINQLNGRSTKLVDYETHRRS